MYKQVIRHNYEIIDDLWQCNTPSLHLVDGALNFLGKILMTKHRFSEH